MLYPLMSDEKLHTLLGATGTIAIVGAKDKPGQPVDGVGRYLIAAGYTVIPVHPVRREVWGLTAFPTLADVPVPVDLVDVFRAPEYCPDHAHEAARLATLPKVFWMQLGIVSTQAEDIARAAGMEVVQNLCLMVAHKRLFLR